MPVNPEEMRALLQLLGKENTPNVIDATRRFPGRQPPPISQDPWFDNVSTDPMMDTSGNWYADIPPVRALYRTVGDETFRKMDEVTRRYSKRTKLSAYYEVARMLEQVHKLYSQRDPQPPDVDDIVILADEDVIYDKVIQMMDACKAAGYDRVALSLIGGEA